MLPSGIIKLHEKILYGTPRYYPGNELAYKFLDLMDQKSFTKGDLTKLRNFGLSVQIAPVEASEINLAPSPTPKTQSPLKANSAIPSQSMHKTTTHNQTAQQEGSSRVNTHHNHHTPPPSDENLEEDSHQVPIWQAPR